MEEKDPRNEEQKSFDQIFGGKDSPLDVELASKCIAEILSKSPDDLTGAKIGRLLSSA